MSKIQRTKLLGREHDSRSAKLFIIATEGQKTEKQYFEMFNNPMDKTGRDFEKRLRENLGSYNKSNLDTDLYKPHIQDAVNRAKKLDTKPEEYWPSTLGSHVYKLVESLQKDLNN